MFHNHIKVNFVWSISVCVEKMLHFYAEWVLKNFQNLKLSVLVPLILENFLNSNMLTGLRIACFVDHSKRPISNNLFRSVALRYNLGPFEFCWDWPWDMRRNHVT